MFTIIKDFFSLRCEITTGCKEKILLWKAVDSDWHITSSLVLCPEHTKSWLEA